MQEIQSIAVEAPRPNTEGPYFDVGRWTFDVVCSNIVFKFGCDLLLL